MKKLKNNLVKHTNASRLYQIPVPIIGLTGGIATGKSTVAELFRAEDIPVIDADKLVKNIYQKTSTLEFLNQNFPEAINSESVIDFKKLREIAFKDPATLKILEDFIYQHLPSEFNLAYDKLLNPTFIVYDVPLLFEKKLHLLIDLSLCVYSPRSTQLSRMISRDHSSPELAEKILDQQISIDEKKKMADYSLDNTGTMDQLKQSFHSLLQDLLIN